MRRYKQISLEEREKIYKMLLTQDSLSKISLAIGRSKSTISRERSRNNSERLGYLPDRANNLSIGRKRRHLSKIENNTYLKNYIIGRLSEDKWSPEMISGRMKLEKQQVCISHEAIYQYIYSYPGQKLRLYEHLMYARPKRQLKCSRRHRYKVAEQYLLKNRPEIINDRSEFGHYEGDLTFFKGNSSGNLSVLVERKSRKSFLIRNNNKTTNLVLSNIINKIKSTNSSVKTITFDNGSEFKRFGLLGLMGIGTYFCNLGSPWQKGQVERTNAVLHKFIPKRSNINNITNDNVRIAEMKLNNLPRKNLNFLTANEVWDINQNVALEA
jgi:IS30 family transposase